MKKKSDNQSDQYNFKIGNDTNVSLKLVLNLFVVNGMKWKTDCKK